MKIANIQDVESKPVEMEGARGCSVRWMLGRQDGAPNFTLRHFEVEPGGYTPRHFHPYEHEVYVLEGNGVVYENDHSHPLRAGDVVLVKPDEIHQFRNTGDTTMKFICLIPNSAADQKVTVAPECGVEANVR
jgi:quercetin dioxygenase-like cupin family protein